SAYDADRGTLKVTVALDWPHLGYEIDFKKRAVLLKHITDPTSSYVGQSGLGVRVKVNRYYAREYSLLPTNLSPSEHSLEALINMNVTVAMAAKRNLRALAIFT